MAEVDDTIYEIIQDIVKAVLRGADPDRIILFGSGSHGELGPDSDVDLLIVERESSFQSGSRWAETSKIRKALWSVPVPIDILLFTPEEMEKWKHSTNHIIARSMREGRVLYDRSSRRREDARPREG